MVTLPQSPVGRSLRIRTTHGASVGEPIRATATLATAGIPAGELTFRVFRPGDEACRRGAVSASTRDVLGDGDYVSDPFTPDEVGTYHIVAVLPRWRRRNAHHRLCTHPVRGRDRRRGAQAAACP